jgi:hypothetical protein
LSPGLLYFGTPDGTRTRDLPLTGRALYPLSYEGTHILTIAGYLRASQFVAWGAKHR